MAVMIHGAAIRRSMQRSMTFIMISWAILAGSITALCFARGAFRRFNVLKAPHLSGLSRVR
jgi:hypothetical protein